MLEYLKDNPLYTIVLIATVVVCAIIITIICICYNKKKKKLQNLNDKEEKNSEILPIIDENSTLTNDDSVATQVEDEEQEHPSDLERALKELSKKNNSENKDETPVFNADKKDEPLKTEKTEEVKEPLKSENLEETPIKNNKQKKKSSSNQTKQDKNIEENTTKPEKNENDQKEEADNEEENVVKYAGKWVIYKDENNRFSADLKASNGELMLSSESYTSLSGIKSGIETLKKNIEKDNFAISLDKNGNFVFKIFSTANRLLCIGEGYSTRDQCEKAFASVKRFSKTAVIVVNKDE